MSSVKPPGRTSGAPGLKLVRIDDVNAAVGAAVRLMMRHPAFAERRFGPWASVLDGQARRGHQAFVLDADLKAVGFFGFGLCSEQAAEDWVAGRRAPGYDECLAGDCVIFNAWIAEEPEVVRFLWDASRRVVAGRKAAYYKRFYRDGRVRPVRLAITAALDAHIAL